jgi:predicted small secreted protein
MARLPTARGGALILTVVIGLLLAGCNTMEGLGKDIQEAGRILENTADRDD